MYNKKSGPTSTSASTRCLLVKESSLCISIEVSVRKLLLRINNRKLSKKKPV